MKDELCIGIIGCDTSHVPMFTRLINDAQDPNHVPGGRVTACYPSFSPDITYSQSRVQGFRDEIVANWGVAIVDSVTELVQGVDAVLLESVDGRRHLSEARPAIEAVRPMFIDKPLAADYAEAAQIVQLAAQHGCPVFSSSSLRFDANVAALLADAELGAVLGCDAYSPATLEPTNPGLFWYGVHGVELLYTFMGRGCERLRCHSTPSYDVVVGWWPDGRVGTVRGTRAGAHEYGVTVFGEGKVVQTSYSRTVPFYARLVQEVMAFFRGERLPVNPEETLEMMAFMQAALVSSHEGRDVALVEVR